MTSATIPFSYALRVWLRVALNSFGGPAGQIAVMHRVLVEEEGWLSEEEFLHALNFCMLLPGPEAQQLATYAGWLLHGVRGGFAAGLLFILPGFLAILLLSILYARFQSGAVEALFFGVKAAVLAIVVEAVLRIGRRALKDRLSYGLAASAFLALFLFDAPFPLVIAVAALVGLGRGSRSGASSSETPPVIRLPRHDVPLRLPLLLLILWLVPVAALWVWLGAGHVFAQQAVLFSKTAVVTFGGAYAVLSYVADLAVETYGWLTTAEMLDGLSLAETTPGPLIMVLQFVGFMAAFRSPGPLHPILAGTLGSVLTTWVTFVPCFLWIFLGAPYVERLRSNRRLAAALTAVTAAVVGVILNLAVWFGLNVLFATVGEARYGLVRLYVPELSSLDLAALILTALAFVLTFRFRLGLFRTLVVCAAIGLVWRLV